MEDWAEIRRLHRAEGMPIKAIVRRTGVSRNAVRRALAADSAPRYSRPAKGSLVDAVEPQIRELLEAWPTMPATVLAERIGWQHSLTILKDRVRVLRPLFLPPDPASRTTYVPGELAQCDLWFPPARVPLGYDQAGSPPVLVMVAGYSRWLEAAMIPSRQAPDLIAGHWLLLGRLGAVPRALVWDNETAVGSWRSGRAKLSDAFEAFRGMLGIRVIQCRPRDPEAKGLVERANRYLETSFLPGRSFSSPDDFNIQLASWLVRANDRQHRAIGCRPSQRVRADQMAMLPLPPVDPVIGWRETVRLPRDYYVRLDGNDYSVHPSVIGRRVEVIAGLDQVSVLHAGKIVAEHERCWARHQSITDPAHRSAADALRVAHRAAANRSHPDLDDLLQHRSLGDYDTAFGLDQPEQATTASVVA